MRAKKPLEKDFNKLAKKYGHKKAFTAQDFDKNNELLKALKSFESAQTYVLADDFSNLKDLSSFHHEFLGKGQSMFDDENIFMKNESIEYTAKLFSLTDFSIAEKIACQGYYDTYANGFEVVYDENGEQIQDFEINEKIEKFHNFCSNLNHAKKFIKNHFLQWEHTSKKDKKKMLDELKKLEMDLSPFCADLKVLKIAYYLISECKRLNGDKECKVNILLHLQLPNIATKPIAKKIVESLSPEYQ